MDNIKNNKLIAEYMHPQFKDLRKGSEVDGDYLMAVLMYTKDYSSLKYHNSWDWLMPVVVKIIRDKSSNCYLSDPNYLAIDDKWSFDMLDDTMFGVRSEGDCPIDAVYNCVVKFIKKYGK